MEQQIATSTAGIYDDDNSSPVEVNNNSPIYDNKGTAQTETNNVLTLEERKAQQKQTDNYLMNQRAKYNNDGNKNTTQKNTNVEEVDDRGYYDIDDKKVESNDSEGEEGGDGYEDLGTGLPSEFVQEIFENLGWGYNPNEDKFNDPTEFATFISDTIQENMNSVYASDEIQALNEYVLNGGRLEDYFENVLKTIDFNQIGDKDIIRQYYKGIGWEGNKVERKISTLEDSGLLPEEADMMRDELEKVRLSEKQRYFQEQKANADSELKLVHQKQMEMKNKIESFQDLFGGKVDSRTANGMFNVLYQPDTNGMTRIDHALNNPEKLAMIAYFEANNWDFDKLMRFKTSDARKQVFKQLQSSTKISKGPKSDSRDDDDGLDWVGKARYMNMPR